MQNTISLCIYSANKIPYDYFCKKNIFKKVIFFKLSLIFNPPLLLKIILNSLSTLFH